MVVTAALLGVLVSGCAGTGAPGGWLPSAAATQEEAHGAWIQVERLSDNYKVIITEGELIAVHEDTVFVLVSDTLEGDLVAIPRTESLEVKLGTYDPSTGGIVGWTLLGSVSTISHGVNLIFTLPIWIITGTVVGNTARSSAIERYPGDFDWDSLSSLRVFARFPQGLTESIDRAALEPKAPEKVMKSRPRDGSRRR